jgi:beta-galactosidase
MVRLYLNDKLIGELHTGREQQFKATFAVPYSAGVLKAVGVDGDKEMEPVTLQTAGEAAKSGLPPTVLKFWQTGRI